MILPYRGRGHFLINGGLRGVEMHQRGRQRKGYGDARCAPARQGWAGAAPARVKVMEMHQGRRPVYGGAPRTGADIQTQTKSHGGSRGPLDPWSAAAASKRRDLWFFRSRKNNDNTICCKKDSREVIPASKLPGHAR